MMSVDDSVDIVLQESLPLDVMCLEAHEADGCVLAESIRSTFSVVERIAAGDTPTRTLKPGQVSYVATGCPVPNGADAVVKIEDTSSVDDHEEKTEVAVTILKAAKAGQNIRPIGSDICPGEVLVNGHELISAAEIGLLATAGITEVVAHRKPVVGVLSTGSELVESFQGETTPGKIRDSNRPMLLALISGWGAKTLQLGVCSDRKEELKELIMKALEKVDVLVASGGVSMGEHDYVKPLLEELGTVHFGRLLMKPGKPTTFATLNVGGKKKLVFALPGNPVSAFTTCHLLVRPALQRLRGLPLAKCRNATVSAVLTHSIKLDADRPEFHRACLIWDSTEHKFLATSTGRQISSRLLSCRNANALLCLPAGTEAPEGHAVAALMLDSTFGNATDAMAAMSTPIQNAESSFQTSAPRKYNAPDRIFRAGLLTISDRVYAGTVRDMSGPAMAGALRQVDKVRIEVVSAKVVPDEVDQIQAVVKEWPKPSRCYTRSSQGSTGQRNSRVSYKDARKLAQDYSESRAVSSCGRHSEKDAHCNSAGKTESCCRKLFCNCRSAASCASFDSRFGARTSPREFKLTVYVMEASGDCGVMILHT
uniref:MoaB/Mog domain-containing protein n=1 Tax=Hyaloperonospora arabidopsidis (strain Emoy2) TaxID=559515 RepID=M4BVR6_HYAAE